MWYNNDISEKITKYALNKEKFFFAIDFDCREGFVLSPDEAAKQGIYFDFLGNTNFKYLENFLAKKKFNIKKIEFKDYKVAFDKVQMHIKRGDTFLVNLTFKTELDTDLTFNEIFNHSSAKFKMLYKDKFVVFSPERFVKIKDGFIESFPMKGTIDASVDNAEEKIINDEKEFCEHTTIVDLIRNDLNIVSQNVEVEKFRYIDKIKSNRGELLQVSSVIKGVLPKNYKQNLGDLIFKMLPAGSISGAPKQKTVEIINSAETYKRGFYTGIFGYFDGENLDTAVAIRFIENENGKLFYKSGGGITTMSNPETEYEELLKKIYVPIT
jgi:para-aminobenzoate synthetase component I